MKEMQHYRIALLFLSYRREITTVLFIVFALILLPILSVIGFLNTGSQAASDALASINATTHRVEVRNIRGELIKTLDAATVWPIKGTVTQEFGNPNPPYQTAHTGIDIDGGYGAPITVFMDGTVVKAGDVLAGCGPHCVIVDHGYGITSIYAHMSSHSVTVGETLHPGDIIGSEGSEGWATGPHLHFEIQIQHIPINPRTFMVGDPQPRS